MTNTYTWFVESLDCLPSVNGQTNVVSNVHWRVNGYSSETTTITNIDGTVITKPTYTATSYGAKVLIYTSGTPFTAYASLTEATIIKWVKEAMGSEQVASIQTNLDNQIATLTNPPIITPPLPWSN